MLLLHAITPMERGHGLNSWEVLVKILLQASLLAWMEQFMLLAIPTATLMVRHLLVTAMPSLRVITQMLPRRGLSS